MIELPYLFFKGAKLLILFRFHPFLPMYSSKPYDRSMVFPYSLGR